MVEVQPNRYVSIVITRRSIELTYILESGGHGTSFSCNSISIELDERGVHLAYHVVITASWSLSILVCERTGYQLTTWTNCSCNPLGYSFSNSSFVYGERGSSVVISAVCTDALYTLRNVWICYWWWKGLNGKTRKAKSRRQSYQISPVNSNSAYCKPFVQ